MATDLVVSASMLDQRIVEAVTMGKPFCEPRTVTWDETAYEEEQVFVYVAKVVEDSIDMHVVVEGKSSLGLMIAMRDIARPSMEPLGFPSIVTEAAQRRLAEKVARRRLDKEAQGKTPHWQPGYYYALDPPEVLPQGAAASYTEDEMEEMLGMEDEFQCEENLWPDAIEDAQHPAYEKPHDGHPKFVSMRATAYRDLSEGTFIEAYTAEAIVFASNDEKEEEMGDNTRSLRDYEFELESLGICVNANPMCNVSTRINDYFNIGEAPNCQFIPYLHIPSDPHDPPRIVILLIITRTVLKKEELLARYGDITFWNARDAHAHEKDKFNQAISTSAVCQFQGREAPPADAVCHSDLPIGSD